MARHNNNAHQQSTSGPWYGVPRTISGLAYKGLPQNVVSRRRSSKTLDKPKSAIYKKMKNNCQLKDNWGILKNCQYLGRFVFIQQNVFQFQVAMANVVLDKENDTKSNYVKRTERLKKNKKDIGLWLHLVAVIDGGSDLAEDSSGLRLVEYFALTEVVV